MSVTTSSNLVAKLVSTPALAGASAAALSAIFYGNLSQSVSVFGVPIPAPIIAGCVVGGASFLTGVLGPKVSSSVSLNNTTQTGRIGEMILDPTICGACLVGLDLIAGPGGSSVLLKSFALGASSQIMGAYGAKLLSGMVALKAA